MLTGTVTEAAELVLRTQPQVSRMIRSLEQAMKLTLFERHGRRLVPTEAALRFLDYVQPSISMLEGLSTFAEDTRLRRHAPLVMMAESFLMHALMPHVLARLAPAGGRDIGADLCIRKVGVWANKNEADFAIVALPFPQTDLVARPFAEAEVVLVTPPGHPLGQLKTVSLDKLVGENFVALRPTTLLRPHIDATLAAAGVTLRPHIETDSGHLACDLVSKGVGVTLADPLVARSFEGTGVNITRLDARIVLRYGILLRQGQPSPEVERALATVVNTTQAIGAPLVRLI